jgi:hypothetical protein
MNNTNVFTKTLFLLIAIGMGVLLNPNDTLAFSTKSINFNSMEPFEINAVISEINLKEAYLIVGEKKVYPIEFKLGSKLYKTAFVNQRGNTSYITSLRPSLWLEERVLVRGFKLANGDIIAGSIKKISSGRR